MQNDGKRSVPIPMTPRNSLTTRYQAAETRREFREPIQRVPNGIQPPRISKRGFRLTYDYGRGPLENVSFDPTELTYRTRPRELARSVTRLYSVNLKTAATMAPELTSELFLYP